MLPLGYCMQFWSPHLKKEIIELEKAQIRVSMLAQGKEGLPIETDPNKTKSLSVKKGHTCSPGYQSVWIMCNMFHSISWMLLRWLDSITDSMDMSLSKLWEIMKGREGHGLTCSSPWGHKESDTTWWLNNIWLHRVLVAAHEIFSCHLQTLSCDMRTLCCMWTLSCGVGSSSLCCAVLCLVAKSCLTLCNTMDCSPPGFFVHGILQARILEWLPFPFLEDVPDQGIKPWSLALQADSLPFELQGSPSLP